MQPVAAKLSDRLAAGGSPWARPALYAALCLLSFAAYHGFTHAWLFNDDFSWLREARHEMHPGNILTHRVVDFFRPLVNLSFWASERLWPADVPLQYSFNIVLHFLCSILVFRLLAGLLGSFSLAAATAVVFSATSVHAAAVFWISARTTLLATFFLLASLSLLVSTPRAGWRRIAASALLYILALASKETAFIGFILLGIIWLHERATGGRRVTAASLAAFTAVSAAYFILRLALMGEFLRQNWGPGWHALRNMAGGFLYQLYPWPLFSLFHPRGTQIAESTHPFMPELLALPAAVILLAAGRAARRGPAMAFAVAWAFAALLPECFFRYRFFSTASITQSRYYYLSSVGTSLAVVILIGMLWNARSRLRAAAATLLFATLVTGYLVRIDRLEGKWRDFTGMYRTVVQEIESESASFPGVTTYAVEGSPLAFPYLEDALVLSRPELRVVEVTGGAEAAARWRPCVYISYSGSKPKVMRMEMLE